MVNRAENRYVAADVRVDSIRFKGNGTIFTARVMDRRGAQTGEEIVIRCLGNALIGRTSVHKGEVWAVEGFRETYKGNPQIGAIRATLKRPDGENIISALAHNPAFAGIGEKKARELWNAFGPHLYNLLDADEPNIPALHKIITPEAAERLVRVWKTEYSGEMFRWLEDHQIPRSLAARLQEHYGREAQAKLTADPYRVLAFGQCWQTVDGVAKRLGVAKDDPRRLHAAVAEALYRHFGDGHTAITFENLVTRLSKMLGGSEEEARSLALAALRHTYANGAYVRTGDLWQATGVFLMEAYVADTLNRLASKPLESVEEPKEETPCDFEGAGYRLGEEQQAAVRLALSSKISVITGGAGVGKTSVLKCICERVEAGGGKVLAMALSGRAAQRITETTRRPAHTIAGFLSQVTDFDLARISHVVIDEASMLDIVSAFRILKKLPEHVSLILVGDPYQLPPIGPGLILHPLSEGTHVPVAPLTKVYRQSGRTGIPWMSDAIRLGEWPTLPEFRGKESGMFTIEAEPSEVTKVLFEVYEELGGPDGSDEVQVLSAIKANNPYGVAGINKAFHDRYSVGENTVWFRSPDRSLVDSGLRQGDRILVTRNQWPRKLFNGSLGRVELVVASPREGADGRTVVAEATIDGRREALAQEDLDWVALGYSISIHKAQGSQFTRVIIPIFKSRLLDRTLLYTAVTRGVEQVILVGDLRAAAAAVMAPPHAWSRVTGLGHLLGRRQAVGSRR